MKPQTENLSTIESELLSLKPRLELIKAELQALNSAKLTREELKAGLLAWLKNQAAVANNDLFTRLSESFLSGDNPDPAILFAAGNGPWTHGKVTATGLLPLILPVVEKTLLNWLSGLPDDRFGQIPRAELTTQIQKLETERGELLARRDTLRRRLKDLLSIMSLSGEQIKAMTAGGVFTGPEAEERLTQKYFESI